MTDSAIPLEEAEKRAHQRPTVQGARRAWVDREGPVHAPSLARRPIPLREWAVDGLVPSGAVTLLSGDGGSGKSTLTLQLGCSTVLGRSWLGKATRRSTAAYISCEDDIGELHRRLAAIASAEDFDIGDLDGLELFDRVGRDNAVMFRGAELRTALAEDFGQKEGLAFIAGSGVKQPEGIMTNADVAAVKNGHATNLSADALIGFMYELPATYRNRGVWMANGATIAKIRSLKDGSGAYVWRPSLAEGSPETVLGRPIIEAPDMDDVASGKHPVVFGDVARAYRIFDRVSISILRDPFSVATSGLVRFHARRRVGGAVVQAAALRKLLMSV